jgi:hypothetical protein
VAGAAVAFVADDPAAAMTTAAEAKAAANRVLRNRM